jgi:hypothetical protein
MAEIVDRAYVGTCEFCGNEIYTRVSEGQSISLPLTDDLVPKTYYTCDDCGKLMCRNCLAKREGIRKRKFYCPDCFTMKK